MVNVTKYKKAVYYQGIKVFNALPSYIKMDFDNPMEFKRSYKNFYMKIPSTP
jgi:hypothetical protein